ncbi:MAG: serine hydrolase domain-containing protein [Gemmatimonadota bacterium]
MLLPLLITAAAAIPADTLLVSGVVLLGEPIDEPTYVREEESLPQRLPYDVYVSMPLPRSDSPGMPAHPTEPPAELGFTNWELDRAVRSVEDEIFRGGFPGAAMAIGRWTTPVVERGIGRHDRSFGSFPVDPDHTIYDLASLTKVVATTTAVMLLVEDGRMELDAPVYRYLPSFSGGDKDRVTIRHLLSHNSGLPAWAQTSAGSPWESLARAIATPLAREPGRRVEYSDIGFVVLWAAAEAAHGGSLDAMLEERVFQPLQMWFTGFNPGAGCLRCAPTDPRDGYRGRVHDPIARHLGGITGNAGLFSTAHDLSRFAAMLVNGGVLDGVRVLRESTIRDFTRRQAGAGTRALGWDTPDEDGRGAGGLVISRSAFGHTGFTGTSLWVDPERGTWTVLLSNRTYSPRGPNRMQALRRELNDRVAVSVDAGRSADR